AALGVDVVPAVAGIVDEQVVLGRQRLAQGGKGADDRLLADVCKQGDVIAVVLLQKRGHGLGVAGRGLQLRQGAVGVVSDDESVVAAVGQIGQFGRDRRHGRGERYLRALGDGLLLCRGLLRSALLSPLLLSCNLLRGAFLGGLLLGRSLLRGTFFCRLLLRSRLLLGRNLLLASARPLL